VALNEEGPRVKKKLFIALCLAAPAVAHAACCYFAAKEKDINQPGQKAFLTWVESEKIESFTVQPKFEGNALDFGMVIPTPSKPKLDEMPRDFFKDLAIYTILMPLAQRIDIEPIYYKAMRGAPGGTVEKGEALSEDEKKGHGVKVLESGVVGSLDYKIIVAEDASGLYAWLKENSYQFGGTEETLDFYIKKKWFFTVMKIDSKAMKKNPDGSYLGEVTPTRFTFESPECVYPLKITQISVKDQTDALFYVQSAQQMDLKDDFSWMHSWRVMYLTYCLGCAASPEEQKELEARNRWIEAKKKKDPKFETTKLEWTRKLGDAEISVLEDPLKNYGQMGSKLPPGTKEISHADFMKAAKEQLKDDKTDRLEWLDKTYSEGKGKIVKADAPSRFLGEYMWLPNREAPEDDVQGLARLKGHLQKGKWLTKFRKVLRKDEMTDDLVLVPVAETNEQDYVRILPTSPP
jgi:hypothetical protein